MNKPLVGLAGLPNSGKTSLFNTLTGGKQRVANFPGVTVERKLGQVKSKEIEVIDLPGLYTLDIHSLDEKIARDFIMQKGDKKLDALVLVVDSTNLEKSLYLALQLKEIGQKFVIALNMIDMAKKRGLKLDVDKLSAEFNCKVVETVAHDEADMQGLIDSIETSVAADCVEVKLATDYQSQIKDPKYIQEKFKTIDQILKNIVNEKIKPDNFTRRVDNILLHPVWGISVLLITLILMFQFLFSWADPVIESIEAGIEWLSLFISSNVGNETLKSFLVDGVIAGVGGFIVFLPHILILFAFILILEDIGYLGRAAFLLDSTMRRMGLPGKSVIPLLSSHACAVPGIMSARIIGNEKDRLATILVSPLTTCSARIPVYTLVVAAAFSAKESWMGLSIAGLVMFALYFLGIASAFIIAAVLKKATLSGPPSTLLMELPPYRIPRLRNILTGLFLRAKIFIKKAGTVILTLSMVIWVLTSYPKAPEGAADPAINYSAAAKIGKTFQPIFKPQGFDWKMVTALIPSFGAREVMVSSLGTIMALDEGNENFESSLREKLSSSYSLATLLALLVWFIYAPQCISTFAIIRRETGSYKWPLFMTGYTLAIAYALSALTYFVVGLLT